MHSDSQARMNQLNFSFNGITGKDPIHKLISTYQSSLAKTIQNATQRIYHHLNLTAWTRTPVSRTRTKKAPLS